MYLGGLYFDPLTLDELLDQIECQIQQGHKGKVIATINSDILLMSLRDATLHDYLARSWMRTADGMPIVWASKLRRQPLPERVTGADLTEKICIQSATRNFRPFLLGAASGVAKAAATRVKAINQSAQIAGTYSPSREELMDDYYSKCIIRMIHESEANILLVALGAPLQEHWIDRYLSELEVNVVMGVGASLDFLSGRLQRAPLWLQKAGAEWLYRLYKEPTRLFRRYTHDIAIVKLLFAGSKPRSRD